MKLISFFTDYNQKTCSASFGLPFEFKGALCDLLREKDGKKVAIVGLTPYTTEKVINIPFFLRGEAEKLCTNYYHDEPLMIEKLEELVGNTVRDFSGGPWHAKDGSWRDDDGKRIGSIDILTERDYFPGAVKLAEVNPYGAHNKSYPNHEEAKGIAQLLAAAPDMFAVIKELYELGMSSGTKGQWFPKAEAAYLKATGQHFPVTNQ